MYKKIIALLLLVLGVTAIVSVAIFNHTRFEKSMIDLVQQQILIIAHIDAGSIQNSIREIERELMFLSQQFFSMPEARISPEMFTQSYGHINNHVSSLELRNAQGDILLRWPPQGQMLKDEIKTAEKDITAMLEHPHIHFGPILNINNNEKGVPFFLPVFKESRLAAFFRAVIPLRKINDWADYVRQRDEEYTLILNDQGQILDYTDKNVIGKNILSVLEGYSPNYDLSEIKSILDEGAKVQEGTKIMTFLSGSKDKPLQKVILAHAPIQLGAKPWHIIVALHYRVVGWPIMRNVMDNAFFLLLLLVSAFIVYKLKSRVFDDEVSLRASNIIIKQLRSTTYEKNNEQIKAVAPKKSSLKRSK